MADLMSRRADTSIERLGSSAFIDGFENIDAKLENGITLRAAIGGSGPPLLLIHGNPQTHVTWRKIAPSLARKFTVVAPDIRGYGDSSKPEGGEDHIAYSKREMAKDLVLLMKTLGHDTFDLAGHDRGGRVAHRLALDHPDVVSRMALLDIAPTATMYAQTDMEFATRYFWWFFLIQPAPLPERMIGADVEYFLRVHIDGQLKTRGATEPRVFDEYLRCYRDPATLHAVCEDYRASATIDLKHDKDDAHRKIRSPLLALWGARGVVGHTYDVLETWKEKASDVRGQALDCGHTLQEELPEQTLNEFERFFV